MHPTGKQCPKTNRRIPYFTLLVMLLMTAVFSLSCQQESPPKQANQDKSGQEGNTTVPSPSPPLTGEPEPIIVTGGSIDLKLRPSGYGPNGNDSVFTCLNCEFRGSIKFKDLKDDDTIPDCSIPSRDASIIRIDAGRNNPGILITAAGGNVSVSLDPEKYKKKDNDRWRRFNGSFKIEGVYVQAGPTATETQCAIPHGKVEFTIPVFKN